MHLVPLLGVTQFEFCWDLRFGFRKISSRAIVWRCLRDPKFIRFSKTPTCDRQTDHDYGLYRASMASRGNKNVVQSSPVTYCIMLPIIFQLRVNYLQLFMCRLCFYIVEYLPLSCRAYTFQKLFLHVLFTDVQFVGDIFPAIAEKLVTFQQSDGG